MPVLTAETLDQELSVLLIAQDSWLSKEIARLFLQQEVAVKQTPLDQAGSSQFIQLLLEKNDFFKIVVVINDPDVVSGKATELFSTLKTISSLSTPKVFVMGFVSHQQSQNNIGEEWKTQIDTDNQILKHLLTKEKHNKLLLGQDMIGYECISLPFSFLTKPLLNDFLLDPQLEMAPLLIEDFFHAIQKELFRPKNKNILVRGSAVASEKILVELCTFFKSYYSKELTILDYPLSIDDSFLSDSAGDLIETIVGSDFTKIIQRIADISIKNSEGLSQKLLAEILPHSPLLITKPSNPFKNKGTEFEFEPPIKNNQVVSGEKNVIVEQQTDPLPNKKNKGEEQKKSKQQPQDNLSNVSSSPDADSVNLSCKSQNLKTNGEITLPKRTIDNLVEVSIKNSNYIEKSNDIVGLGNTPTSLNDSDLDDQLGRLFKTHRTHQKTERRKEKANLMAKIKRKSRNKQIIFFIGVFVLSLGLLLGAAFSSMTLNLHLSEKQLQKQLNNYLSGQVYSTRSLWALQAETTVLDTLFDTPVISSSELVIEIDEQLKSIDCEATKLKQINRFMYQSIVQSDQPISSTNQDISSQQHAEQTTSLAQLAVQQDEILVSIAEATDKFSKTLEGANLKLLAVDTQSLLQKVPEKIKKLESTSQVLKQINPILTEIMASKGQKYYYLLLQDNLELRPTGGFLQAIACLVVENGKLIDYQVYSVDELDAKQPGAVQPPPEVEAYLGERQLYLRDANWDPDFSSSAKQIAWFLRESLNQPVDGIIATNYSQVKELLVVLGNIYLEESAAELTPNNLYSRLEALAFVEKKQADQESVPVQLLKALLNKLIKAQPDQLDPLQEVLLNGLRQQQTSIYLADPQLGGVFSQLGWTGSLVQPECPPRFGGGCYKDYLYQVEANIGVNKVNQHILSRINHSIQITPERVEHTRQIKYTNNAQSPSWPLGPYKTYLRFYVNAESTVAGVMVNRESLASKYVTEYLDHNRKVIGIVVEVPIESEIEIVVKYYTPHQIKKGESYFFFEQSQSGVMNRLSSIALTHPDALQAELISPLVEVNQNQIVVTSDQGVGFLAIQFAKE